MAEFDYNQLMDDYLKGSISDSDKILFESKLNTDPAFKSEFEFQKDVFNVIRNSRIAQLKSALSSVQVPWYYTVSAGWKIAITAGVISLAGLSSYYLYRNSAGNQKENKIELNSTDIQEMKSPEKLPVPAVKESQSSEEIRKKDSGIKKTIKSDTEPTRVTAEKPDDGDNSNTPAEIKVPQPDMDQSAGNTADNNLNVSGNNDFNSAANIDRLEEKIVAVKITSSREYNFDYTFIEGSLTLYGNFSGSPYKILEINSSKGKDYFLLYNEKFYSLKQNTRNITPLELVKNQELINELNILKNNK
jgi:hypothetical protein